MSTLSGRGLRTVQPKTADYTVVANTDNGLTFTNEGAAGAITFALPVATVGQWYRFKVMTAQQLRVDPSGTQTIALPSSGAQQAAGSYIVADAAGEGCEIECVKAGQWEVNWYTGTWTAV